jgi:apolipoprotein N-acyltransferase
VIPSAVTSWLVPNRAHWAGLGAGVLLVATFAPLGWFWLSPCLLALLLLLWEGTTPRQAAKIGFAFSFGSFAAGTWWLYISLNILGGLVAPLALLLMLLLMLAMAVYGGVVGYVLVKLSPQSGPIRWLLLFPALWTLFEWLRGWLLSGFPWMSLGYGHATSPLGALAPVTGMYGITLAIVLLAGALVTIALGSGRQRNFTFVVTTLAAVTIWFLASIAWTHDTGSTLDIRLVQGAVPQDKKWRPEQLEPTLQLYTELSRSDQPLDLIVWPEAAIPALQFEVADFIQDLRAQMVAQDTQLFTGMLKYDLDSDIYLNTLWAFGAEEGEYYKRHLVPFGEYFPVPDFVRSLLRLMNLPSENISAGSDQQALLYAKGIPVAASICYELAYGAEQLTFFPAAQLMVNVSNDAWFGDTIAPHQHLQIGQMRARESGRYLLRATNTGLTAVVAPDGRVVEQMAQFEPGFIDAKVAARAGRTPYMLFGNWLVVGMALAMVATGVWAGRSRSSP